ncbi:Pathogenicity locus [Natronincola peptidivorans]|uniref:Pathogenicity locus n=1 Tax=Natronincola peptidivorans TaxID=426128 RepID=A0A1I0DP43_9FIRM|nr:helix-hairpin-helix domain-containing protein [Natronincola peptidivorans]SET33482.1 Pathogenicity locus [Natronincola peptidivorans]
MQNRKMSHFYNTVFLPWDKLRKSEGYRMRPKDQLIEIPGVGKKIEAYFQQVGISKVTDLKGRDPQELYERLCHMERFHFDPCLLYVFRCAVYYAENQEYDPELLKWWNWKDRKKRGITND